MNTPLEVMKAIVENGNPIIAWVGCEEGIFQEIPVTITTISLIDSSPFYDENGDGWEFCSLTNPHKIKRRQMTAEEFAHWAFGKRYAWKYTDDDYDDWFLNIYVDRNFNIPRFLWTELDSPEFLSGNPVWHEVPEVEV